MTWTSRLVVELIQKWTTKLSSAATTKLFGLMLRELGKTKTRNPRIDNDSTYIQWGCVALVSRSPARLRWPSSMAVCDSFTCAIVAMVVNQDSFFLNETNNQVKNPILAGTSVEVVELVPR